MKLLFDGRALQSGIRSGVPRVAEWWLHELAKEHEVTVFTTGIQKQIPAFAGMTICRHVHLRMPNKLLHLALWLFGYPKLDRLVSRRTQERYDAVVLPNLHFFAAETPTWLLVHDLSFLVLPSFLTPFERFIHALKRPRALMQNAARIFAVSRSTKRDIERFTGRKDTELIDVSGAATRNLVPHRGGARRDIIFLSTTEPRKNLERAIEGFLAAHLPDRLLIIGNITREGQRLQVRYRAYHTIVWLGAIPDAERTALLARAKALLYPSRYEGFGLPLLEAHTLGTPIITSSYTSMPEIAPRAILIDPHRPETITLALKML